MYVASQDAHLSPLFFFEYKKKEALLLSRECPEGKKAQGRWPPSPFKFSFTVRTPWPTGASHHFLSLFSPYLFFSFSPSSQKTKKCSQTILLIGLELFPSWGFPSVPIMQEK